MADTDWRRMIVVAVAVTACGFNSGGDGADATGETSATSATDPTTDPATTDPATTNPTTTDPATTDPATTDPSTDPTTTDPTTDPTTTDATTEPTTDPATTDDETTETDPSQGSSTGGDPGLYGPCDDNTCPGDQMCAVAQNENNTVVANSCRPPCGELGDCPAPPSGSPQLFCPAANDYPWCVLGCQRGVCPDGMECYPTLFGEHCHWPL